MEYNLVLPLSKIQKKVSNNNANTFCSVLVLAISKECLVKKKNINTDATIKISSIIIAVLKYLEYLILCIN